MGIAEMMGDLEFSVFIGEPYKRMPMLIAAGLVPANAMQIMHGWLEGTLDREWYHDSGDAIAYHPDGRIKLIWNSDDLCALNMQSVVMAGEVQGLLLPAGAWESLDGRVLCTYEIAKYTGRTQSKEHAKGNPFWQWLARDDRDLLGGYADQMFGCAKERHGFDASMGVYVGKIMTAVPVLRQWCLGGIQSNGFASAASLLGMGRLAGIKPPN